MLKKYVPMLALIALTACEGLLQTAQADTFDAKRCVNMGNALDAPREGDWGHTIDLDNFARIREAGFDTVRIPVRWSSHLGQDRIINRKFRSRVDDVLNAALLADLNVVLNIHHYQEFMEDPEGNYETFLGIWQQLAYYYQNLPERVAFEVINEPHKKLKGEILQRAQKDALAIIRQNNPTRAVILGGENWSNIDSLNTNFLPSDPNIIYTFHYYNPYNFTHQKAPFAGPTGPKKTLHWGTDAELEVMRLHIARAKEFSESVDRKVFLGEFGAFQAAPEQSRRAYMSAVTNEAEAAGIGWCAWSFTSSFPLFDDGAKTWIPGQLEALGLPAP